MNSTNRVRHSELTKEQKYKKILELVKKHGFSQKEACEKYGINEKTFSAWKIKQDPRSSLRASVTSSVRKSPLVSQKPVNDKNGQVVWKKTVDDHPCFEKMEITLFEKDGEKFVVLTPKVVLIAGKAVVARGSMPSYKKDLFVRVASDLKKLKKTHKQFQTAAMRAYDRGEWKFRDI
jgi:hypothetical protein